MNGLTVRYKVNFGRVGPRAREFGPRSQTGPQAEEVAKPAPGGVHGETSQPVSRGTRMLALAHYVERLVEDGAIKDYAEAARTLGMTRARMTQVMNLLSLSPEIQVAVLEARLPWSERRLRALAATALWEEQAERLVAR